MATQKGKMVKLRAFEICNNSITRPNSGILDLLLKILSKDSSAQQRRLHLNELDDDEDLLSSFEWQSDNRYLFGMMLRIIPSVNSGEISEDLFSRDKITVSDIENGSNNTFHTKDLFYFAINNTHVVTNLSGVFPIDRLQTYINWLIRTVRGEQIFNFVPKMTLPTNVKLSDVKSVEFGGILSIPTTSDSENIMTKVKNLSVELFKDLFDSTGDFQDVLNEQIVSAKLVFNVKRKPKEMDSAEFQKVMGALMKPITNDKGVLINTKTGKIDGSEIKKTKNVKIETTSNKRLVEEQLKQEMETFLNELNE